MKFHFYVNRAFGGQSRNVSLISVVWTKCLVSQQSISVAKSANVERTSMHCILTTTHIHHLVSQPYAWVDKSCHAFDYLRPYSSQVGAFYLRHCTQTSSSRAHFLQAACVGKVKFGQRICPIHGRECTQIVPAAQLILVGIQAKYENNTEGLCPFIRFGRH